MFEYFRLFSKNLKAVSNMFQILFEHLRFSAGSSDISEYVSGMVRIFSIIVRTVSNISRICFQMFWNVFEYFRICFDVRSVIFPIFSNMSPTASLLGFQSFTRGGWLTVEILPNFRTSQNNQPEQPDRRTVFISGQTTEHRRTTCQNDQPEQRARTTVFIPQQLCC